MGCFSSVNLSISPDKKENDIKPLNKTELPNDTYEDHSYKINEDNNNNNNKLNINNIPFDVLKSYQYYMVNKNYKSCDVGKEVDKDKKDLKVKMVKIKKNDKKESKEEVKNINFIEDMDVDINLYKKFIIKKENKKKDEEIKENKLENHIDIKEKEENNNDINNSDKKKDKILRKSIEERITKFEGKNNQENNKELEDSICNLGQSYYFKTKGD